MKKNIIILKELSNFSKEYYKHIKKFQFKKFVKFIPKTSLFLFPFLTFALLSLLNKDVDNNFLFVWSVLFAIGFLFLSIINIIKLLSEYMYPVKIKLNLLDSFKAMVSVLVLLFILFTIYTPNIYKSDILVEDNYDKKTLCKSELDIGERVNNLKKEINNCIERYGDDTLEGK